ncbi:hypothetical protein VTP01DRAFT_10863 [Rhizomucor pusillus]|uniref:uncharacterized protein n=1 Tax=Rhizomucor pusillus TaxID=4840 RepID=UPI003742AA56
MDQQEKVTESGAPLDMDDFFGEGGLSEEERLSDVEGSGQSDVEDSDAENARSPSPVRSPSPKPVSADEQRDPDYAAEAEPEAEMSVRKKQKLPSFRRRERTEEEEAELQRIKQEIREKKKRGKSRVKDGEQDEEEDENAEPPRPMTEEEIRTAKIMEEFDRNVAKLQNTRKRRKKADEEDLERSMDEELMALRERMRNAADEDTMANNERRPATAKLKMLNEAMNILTNKRIQDNILDNQLLDAIRVWLEPLPDRSLPSLDIQSQMLDALDSLPIASDHLRESGVGKIVYFYQKSPRVDPRIKRKAEQLIAKWSRLVIKRSANYSERQHELREYRHEAVAPRVKRVKMDAPAESSNAGSLRQRYHVSIPQAVAPDYDIIPQSTIKVTRHKTKEQGGSFKRLKTTMRSLKASRK